MAPSMSHETNAFEIGGGFAFANALGQGLPVAGRLLKAAAGESESITLHRRLLE